MDTIPEIIQSMKNSPDEINRKRYELFLEQYSRIEDLEAELAAYKYKSAHSPGNAHLYPSDHYGL